MSTQKKTLRRSGAKIMASLILLLGSLSYIMILAVINGSVGFVCAMGVTVFGAIGVAKALGEAIALSYGWIIGLTIGCGVLRGLLRYFEQYSNHYIAFRLLAALRDKIFGALRVLCPAKLESKQKGDYRVRTEQRRVYGGNSARRNQFGGRRTDGSGQNAGADLAADVYENRAAAGIEKRHSHDVQRIHYAGERNFRGGIRGHCGPDENSDVHHRADDAAVYAPLYYCGDIPDYRAGIAENTKKHRSEVEQK